MRGVAHARSSADHNTAHHHINLMLIGESCAHDIAWTTVELLLALRFADLDDPIACDIGE